MTSIFFPVFIVVIIFTIYKLLSYIKESMIGKSSLIKTITWITVAIIATFLFLFLGFIYAFKESGGGWGAG